jgi:hypothetical protein
MPILDLQKRARELGRIRLGQKSASGAPQKLDRFRVTANSQALLHKIAALYGGEVRPWEGGTQAFEVVTDSNRLPIMVPPQPISQWHERGGSPAASTAATGTPTSSPTSPATPRTRPTSRPWRSPPPGSTSCSATSRDGRLPGGVARLVCGSGDP